jgi:tetratricopeptide (TPR) repeat protein
MSIEHQAEQLARWLEANPGTRPPEGMDPEVIEAVYALRPDLAPPARVSVDDILASIETGPLSQPEEKPVQMAEVIELAQRRNTEEAAIASAAATLRSRPRSPAPTPELKVPISPRFLLGTVGSVALLAAAIALFILVPALQGGFLVQQTNEQLAMATESTLEVEDLDALEEEDEAMEALDELPAPSATAPAFEAAEPVPEQRKYDDRVGTPRPPQISDVQSAPEPLKKSGAALERDHGKMVQDLAPSTQGIELGQRGGSAGYNAGNVIGDTLQATPPAMESTAYKTEEKAMSSVQSSEAVRAAPKTKTRGKRTKTMDASEDEEEEDWTSWDNALPPYPTDWRAPGLTAKESDTLADARKDAERAQHVSAAETLEKAIPLSKSAVGQYFAAEAATYYLEAAQFAKAIKVANRCVGLSAQNTPHLSRCYCELGKAYRDKGDREKSQAAYEKAARLNGKR